MTLKNPKVWGPGTWILLHSLARKYEPSKWEDYLRFYHQLLRILPCRYCRQHSRSFFHLCPPGPKEEWKTAEDCQRWTIDFHNYVNRRVQKPELSKTEAMRQIRANVWLRKKNITNFMTFVQRPFYCWEPGFYLLCLCAAWVCPSRRRACFYEFLHDVSRILPSSARFRDTFSRLLHQTCAGTPHIYHEIKNNPVFSPVAGPLRTSCVSPNTVMQMINFQNEVHRHFRQTTMSPKEIIECLEAYDASFATRISA